MPEYISGMWSVITFLGMCPVLIAFNLPICTCHGVAHKGQVRQGAAGSGRSEGGQPGGDL
jgi:hypothetical protein